MPPNLTDEEIRKIAKSRVGFKAHLLVYVAVNILLALIWLITINYAETPVESTYYWPIWPHIGWGVGVTIHGFLVYGAGLDWERREEESIRRRLGRT